MWILCMNLGKTHLEKWDGEGGFLCVTQGEKSVLGKLISIDVKIVYAGGGGEIGENGKEQITDFF